MKSIGNDPNTPMGDDRLLRDLGFIKQKLRYPFRRKIIFSLLTSSLLLLAIILRAAWAVFFAASSSTLWTVVLFIIVIFIIPVISGFSILYRQMRFLPVLTGFTAAENMALIQRFLEKERIVMYRHPKAPEIFQIMSRNISTIGEEREILTFIADDKRILINSHFSSTRRFRLFNQSGSERRIAKMLKAFVN